MTDESLTDLLELWERGDPRVLELIWRQFGGHLRRVARRRLRWSVLNNHFDTMDICQSMLADLLRVDRPADVNDLEAYCVRAILNKLRNKEKAARAERRDIRRTEDLPAEECFLATTPRPEQTMSEQEFFASITNRLDETERNALTQRLAGADWKQIAAELNVSADTLRKRIQRACLRFPPPPPPEWPRMTEWEQTNGDSRNMIPIESFRELCWSAGISRCFTAFARCR